MPEKVWLSLLKILEIHFQEGSLVSYLTKNAIRGLSVDFIRHLFDTNEI